MDIQDLMKIMQNFRLEDGELGPQGYKRVLLQLFGLSGHGKSSFINSCLYVLNEEKSFKDYVGPSGPNGGTFRRTEYALTEAISVVDNRGMTGMDGYQTGEIYAQLGNFRPLGKDVIWINDKYDKTGILEDWDRKPNSSDLVVPIFVFSSTQRIRDAEMDDMKRFMSHCSEMTGIFPIIVLTFKTKGDHVGLEKRFRQMGAEIVVAVENYTTDSPVKTLGRTVDILMVLYLALRSARFRLHQPRDLIRERMGRKMCLFSYNHHLTPKNEKITELSRDSRRTIPVGHRRSDCAVM